jgi:hypothetical protein
MKSGNLFSRFLQAVRSLPMQSAMWLTVGVMGFFDPSMAMQPALTSPRELAAQWQDPPNLDARMQWKESPPESLQGTWEIIGSSKDCGKTFNPYREPEPLIVIRQSGWSRTSIKNDDELHGFIRIGQMPDAGDAETWFFALKQDPQPLMVHVPKSSQHIVVRQFKLDTNPEGLRESERWVVVVRKPASTAAEQGPSGQFEDSRPTVRMQTSAPGDEKPSFRRGVLGVEGWGNWSNSPEEFADEFERRGLKPTSGKGLFIRDLSEQCVEGLRENDILVRINGIQIVDDASWKKALSTLRADEDAKVAIKRSEGGGAWKMMTLTVKPLDADRLAELRKQKAADQAKRDAEAREARQKAVFRMADGGTATGAEIDQMNERVRARCVRQVLAMNAETRFRYTRGTDAINQAASLLEVGDRKGLANLVSRAAVNGTARDIEQTVFLRTDYDELLVGLKDGRAITYEELWGEAALEAARAMSP